MIFSNHSSMKKEIPLESKILLNHPNTVNPPFYNEYRYCKVNETENNMTNSKYNVKSIIDPNLSKQPVRNSINLVSGALNLSNSRNPKTSSIILNDNFKTSQPSINNRTETFISSYAVRDQSYDRHSINKSLNIKNYDTSIEKSKLSLQKYCKYLPKMEDTSNNKFTPYYEYNIESKTQKANEPNFKNYNVGNYLIERNNKVNDFFNEIPIHESIYLPNKNPIKGNINFNSQRLTSIDNLDRSISVENNRMMNSDIMLKSILKTKDRSGKSRELSSSKRVSFKNLE